jgi:hypothetical protein
LCGCFQQVVDKYPFTHFMRALKSVQARDLTNIGGALQRIFSFLHIQRLAHDIDRYGNPTTTTFLAFVFTGSFLTLSDSVELLTVGHIAY